MRNNKSTDVILTAATMVQDALAVMYDDTCKHLAAALTSVLEGDEDVLRLPRTVERIRGLAMAAVPFLGTDDAWEDFVVCAGREAE